MWSLWIWEINQIPNFLGFKNGTSYGTLMQIWKSANIFVFIWKYVEDFTIYFLRYAHERYVKNLFTNIQKQ